MRKRGRPKKDNPKSKVLKVRTDDNDMRMIDDIVIRSDGATNPSQVVRAALRYYYHTFYGSHKRD